MEIFAQKKQLKRRIFTKLIGSFFLLIIIVTITFIACLFLDGLLFMGGDMENLMPYNIVDSDGKVQNIDAVIKLGGWIEELDPDYQIIKVYGDKKTDI